MQENSNEDEFKCLVNQFENIEIEDGKSKSQIYELDITQDLFKLQITNEH
jgi:hypothetical protein